MGWINRKPRVKEPPRQTPHYTSPMTEQKMEEAKERGPSKKYKSNDKNKS